MVRKPTVTSGNTDWAISAGTTTENSEWVVDDISSAGSSDFLVTLGSHVIAGGENISPIVNAGGNQTVLLGSSVTLDGSLSTDPDGTIGAVPGASQSGHGVEEATPGESFGSF